MTTITQTITAPPTAPSRADPSTFSTRADAFVAWLEDNPAELNTLAGQINTVAGEVAANAVAAAASEDGALAARHGAENAAAVVDFQGAYNADTAFGLGQTVSYGGVYWVSLQPANLNHTPAGGSLWWAPTFAMTIPSIALGSGWDIDLGAGIDFTRTVAGTGAFTISNVPASGVVTFVLEVTYTSGAITFFSGYTVNWPVILDGVQPVFAAGKRYKLAMEIRGGTTAIDVISVLEYA